MRIPKYRNGIILYYPRLLFRLALIYLQSKSAAFHPEFGSNIIIDEEAVSQSFKQRHRPPPSLRRQKKWDNDDYVRRACEKSRAALDGLMKLKLSNADDDDQHHRHELSHLIEVTTVENLCLVDSKGTRSFEREKQLFRNAGQRLKTSFPNPVTKPTVIFWSYEDANLGGGDRWGSEDIMLDLGSIHIPLTPEQRVEYLRDAANFRGGAVYLLNLLLTREEESAWLEALSVAADRGDGPGVLTIHDCGFNNYDLISTLTKSKGLRELSLQGCPISDECIEVLSGLSSLTNLSLQQVFVSPDFAMKLAGVDPSRSPLAASLQRLELFIISKSAKPSLTSILPSFLLHWPQLKELTLREEGTGLMYAEDVVGILEQLAEWKKMNLPSASPAARLYSLTIGPSGGFYIYNTGQIAIARVVDALYRSSLPFLQLLGRNELLSQFPPAIKAQLLRNQLIWRRHEQLQSKKVPATSLRLFICGDEFAGKTTLLSSMHSLYSSKRHKLPKLVTGCGHIEPNRTQGIEVRAMKKDGIRVSLWDMAGQPEFYAFHDSMFPDIGTGYDQTPSIFMFVWSPMKSKNSHKGPKKTRQEFEISFRYWLKFLASKSRKSNIALKVIMVFTRADQMKIITSEFLPSIESFQSEFKEAMIDIVCPLFEVDARKKDSVQGVAEKIFSTAKEMLQDVQVYDICRHVTEHLSKYLKRSKHRIITWSEFSGICSSQFSIHNEDAKLHAIAQYLNESGIIIYINNLEYIVLDPNWFCNQIMGSLIHFSNSKAPETIDTCGVTSRVSLEERLELLTKCDVKGSFLVDLMEAMHLCCEVPNYKSGASSSNGDLFIPAALTANQYNIKSTTLQWRSSTTCGLDNDTNYVYMGRRLECENKNLTFLTPGLFPRIQVLFNNAFHPQDNADVKLGKDFVSICLPHKEIIVVFCQARSDNVIDVLVRAPLNNNHQDMARTLAYVEDRIINNLIIICAQPTGIQGVTLIESVIRPSSLRDPSRAELREDQCVTMTYLKQQLRSQLEEGESKFYHLWNQTDHMPVSITDPLIDLLGLENYMEVVMSYGAWLKEVKDAVLLVKDEETSGSEQHERHQDATMTTILEDILDLSKVPQEEDEISEEGVEVQSSNKMVRAILHLSDKVDANQEENIRLHRKNYTEIRELHHKMDEMSNKLNQIHQELQLTRRDIVTNVQSVVERLLKFAVENEDEKRLPSVVVLTTDGVGKIRKWVTSLSRNHVVSVRVELCCEDRTLPHPVVNQRGITITSLSESLSQGLGRALPYINGFLCALTIAAKLGSSYGVPFPASPILELLPYLKDMKQYPMVSTALMDMSVGGPSSISRVCPSTSESFKEWQKCLASILKNNGDLTSQNIEERFGLKRAKYKNGEGVAWLCDEHYKGHAPFSLG